jgi:hypothetical protein
VHPRGTLRTLRVKVDGFHDVRRLNACKEGSSRFMRKVSTLFMPGKLVKTKKSVYQGASSIINLLIGDGLQMILWCSSLSYLSKKTPWKINHTEHDSIYIVK